MSTLQSHTIDCNDQDCRFYGCWSKPQPTIESARLNLKERLDRAEVWAELGDEELAEDYRKKAAIHAGDLYILL